MHSFQLLDKLLLEDVAKSFSPKCPVMYTDITRWLLLSEINPNATPSGAKSVFLP